MKKIMLAVAIVCAAVMTQAASVQWQSGVLTDSKGTALTAANLISGYVFELTSADYDKYAAMDASTLSKTLYADFGEKLGSAAASGKNTYSKKAGGALDLTPATDYTAPATAYAAIIYMDDANGMVMGNVATASIEAAMNVKVSNLANQIGGTGAATSWQSAAAPEPTSGLLLLIGMAGLALKRRRA